MTMENVSIDNEDEGVSETALKERDKIRARTDDDNIKDKTRTKSHAKDRHNLHQSAVVKNSDSKKVYVPFADLIEKFHKIREGRTKSRLGIVCDNYNATGGKLASNAKTSDSNAESDDTDTSIKRPSSARLGICERLKTEIGTSRRMSLPSIFRPGSIPPSTDVPDGQEPKKQNVHVGVAHGTHNMRVGFAHGTNPRRYSMPYVIKEYAKHDVDKLEAELKDRCTPVDVKAKAMKADRLIERGIDGEKLHAFYNLWENQHTPLRKPVKPVVRRLEALLRENDNTADNVEGRPRLFTF